MNRETTEFASWRFAPRVSRENSTSCAVEHFKPARWKHVHEAVRMAAAFGCAVLIGVMVGKSL